MAQVKFLIDECVPPEIANVFAVKFTTHSLPKQTPDAELAAFARENGYAILTWDNDFLDTKLYPPEQHPGIILFRHSNRDQTVLYKFVQEVLAFIKHNEISSKAFVVRMKSGEANTVEIVPPGTPRRPHPKGTKNPNVQTQK